MKATAITAFNVSDSGGYPRPTIRQATVVDQPHMNIASKRDLTSEATFPTTSRAYRALTPFGCYLPPVDGRLLNFDINYIYLSHILVTIIMVMY